MRHLLLSFAALLLTTNALAKSSDIDVNKLPKLSGHYVTIHPGQGAPNIKLAPAVVLHVKHRSCNRQTLTPRVYRAKELTYVWVQQASMDDCPGPVTAHEYHFNLGNFARNVVVLNPVDEFLRKQK